MLRWEFIDLVELRPKNPMEKVPRESETQKLVVLPGFEVAQEKQKPINNIIIWANCYARYVGAMAIANPASMPGFMAHMITLMKAYTEVDVQLYQEVCAGRLRRKLPEQGGVDSVQV